MCVCRVFNKLLLCMHKLACMQSRFATGRSPTSQNCARVSVQLSRSHRVRPRSMNFQAKAQLLGAARTSDGGVNLSQGTQIDVVIKSLREKLESENGVMNAFHALDVDNSNSLTIDEFGECLKSIGITLPKTHLSAVIARFDANGAHLHTSQPCCSDYCSDYCYFHHRPLCRPLRQLLRLLLRRLLRRQLQLQWRLTRTNTASAQRSTPTTKTTAATATATTTTTTTVTSTTSVTQQCTFGSPPDTR